MSGDAVISTANPPPHPNPTMSPFHLGNQDNPGNTITHVQLHGENYDEWARSIRLAVKARRKFGFVDGTIAKPTENLDDWSTIHSMIVSWIMNTVEPSLRTTISYYEDAALLCKDLKDRFCVVNGIRDYIANHEQLRSCDCGNCTCNLGPKFGAFKENKRLHKFLSGLDNSYYATLRSNLLNTSVLPSVNHAYQAAIQEKMIRTNGASTTAEDTEVLAFQVQSDFKPKGKSVDNSDKYCTHCTRNGHDESMCFLIHGYPDWWGDRPRGPRNSGRGGSSKNGRGSSARAPSAGRGKGTTTRINSTYTDNTPAVASASLSSDPSSVTGLTTAQWQQLLDLLNIAKSKDHIHGKNAWIIDTGATNHVTGTLTYLHDIQNITSSPVSLPNGVTTNASHRGRVILDGGLVLTDVLYVPGLTCSLISVLQLLDALDCIIQCTKSFCVIQDRQTRRLIGAGKRQDGLYFYRGVSNVAVCNINQGSTDLWHKRLGHPSSEVLKLLAIVKSSSRLSNKACDVCLRAKQTRFSFNRSDNKVISSFELIHCDLWGSYRTPSSCGATYFFTLVDDYSCGVWVYLLRTKDEVPRLFLEFIAMIKRQFGAEIKKVRSDNWTEFSPLKP
ncbi:uncharacterized protein LOC141627989 [Silene latifolia]|uniref:uncharacterized protein LOC141627989 n=1 Tax=Silene latifolia TaxID=37657 RepID=UPI003D783C35